VLLHQLVQPEIEPAKTHGCLVNLSENFRKTLSSHDILSNRKPPIKFMTARDEHQCHTPRPNDYYFQGGTVASMY